MWICVSSRTLLYYDFNDASPSFPTDESVAAAQREILRAIPSPVRPIINSLNAAQTIKNARAVLTPNVLGVAGLSAGIEFVEKEGLEKIHKILDSYPIQPIEVDKKGNLKSKLK